MWLAQSHQVLWEGHQTHWTVEWMLIERDNKYCMVSNNLFLISIIRVIKSLHEYSISMLAMVIVGVVRLYNTS